LANYKFTRETDILCAKRLENLVKSWQNEGKALFAKKPAGYSAGKFRATQMLRTDSIYPYSVNLNSYVSWEVR
jgi:hypothetical protein